MQLIAHIAPVYSAQDIQLRRKEPSHMKVKPPPEKQHYEERNNIMKRERQLYEERGNIMKIEATLWRERQHYEERDNIMKREATLWR